MRLEQLRVRHFGRFDDYTLDIPKGTRFVVLYGENGTGKTTLLNAFRSLLFGIEEKTPYSEGERDSPVLSATFGAGKAGRLELTRHKRRKIPLVGNHIELDGTPSERQSALDELSFAALVKLPDRKLYEKVFGFTLSDLESGAKVLEEATVSELLAGGALGGDARRIRELMREIDERQAALFRHKAQNPAINHRKGKLDKHRAEKTKLQMGEAAYSRQQTDLHEAEQGVVAQQESIKALTRREADLGRLITAYPHWETFCRLQMEFVDFQEQAPDEIPLHPTNDAPLDSPQTLLSTTQIAEVRRLFQQQNDAQRAFVACRAEVVEQTTKLEEDVPDTAVLDQEVLITSLVKQIEAMARLRRDIPRDEQKQGAERSRLERALTVLLPTAALDDVEEEVVLAKHFSEIQRYHLTYQRSEEAYKRVVFQCSEKSIALENERDRLAEASQTTELPEDVALLLPVLEPRKQLWREFQQTEDTLRKRSAELNRRLQSLRPSLPSDEPLLGLLLPSRSVLEQMAEDRRSALRQVETTQAKQVETARKKAAADAALASLSENLTAPLPETKAEARKAREKAFQAWEASGYGTPARAVYLQTVDKADACADRLLEASERIARLAEARKDVAELQADAAVLEIEVQKDKENFATWQSHWLKFWSAKGVTASCQPDGCVEAADVLSMIEWRDEVSLLQEISLEIAQLEALRETHLKVLLPFETRLRNLFQEAAATPLLELITRLEELGNVAREAETLRRSGVTRIASIQRDLTELETQRDSLKSEMNVITVAGHDYMALMGVPTDTALASAEVLLEQLLVLRRDKTRWDANQEALEAKKRDLFFYDSRVAQLRDSLDTPTGSRSLQTQSIALTPVAGTTALAKSSVIDREFRETNEDFVVQLETRLSRAKIADGLYQERQRNLRAAQERSITAETLRNGLETECGKWLERLEHETESDLLQTLDREDVKHRLQDEHQRAWNLLRVALGPLAEPGAHEPADIPLAGAISTGTPQPTQSDTLPAAVVQRFKTKSVAALKEEHVNLKNALQAAHKELSLKQSELATIQETIKRRDGQDAALNSAEYEEHRAALQQEMEDYIVQFLAGQVLKRVVDRFARENQPALLQNASILIERITDGQYTSIRQSDDEKTLALVPCRTGENIPPPRTPDRLSTGEREQMFLALRLAFVEHYCQSYQALPIVLDDVLVNFDERRAASTLGALAAVAESTQVLFFTCHNDLRELARATVPEAYVVNLPPL